MSRWQPHARERLERAALELYAERGFDQTTVDEIARRAGLTERTFFRHYADKREVLFGGQDALIALLTEAVAAAPESAALLDVVAAGLAAAGQVFDTRRAQARQRQRVIAANPSLQERELSKLAVLSRELTDALTARGADEAAARLTAETGIAVFKVAFERWVGASGSPSFAAMLTESFDELKTLALTR